MAGRKASGPAVLTEFVGGALRKVADGRSGLGGKAGSTVRAGAKAVGAGAKAMGSAGSRIGAKVRPAKPSLAKRTAKVVEVAGAAIGVVGAGAELISSLRSGGRDGGRRASEGTRAKGTGSTG